MSNSYRDLVAWQVAVELVTNIYRSTESFPKHELYGLTSQIRRAAVSVPSNVAEGQGRNSPGEFQQFLGHAKGSLMELETQLIIARNLKYLAQTDLDALLKQSDRVSRLVNGLLQSLKRREGAPAEKRGTRNERPAARLAPR